MTRFFCALSRALETNFPISLNLNFYLFFPFFLTNLRKISYSRTANYYYIYSLWHYFSLATIICKIAYVEFVLNTPPG